MQTDPTRHHDKDDVSTWLEQVSTGHRGYLDFGLIVNITTEFLMVFRSLNKVLQFVTCLYYKVWST